MEVQVLLDAPFMISTIIIIALVIALLYIALKPNLEKVENIGGYKTADKEYFAVSLNGKRHLFTQEQLDVARNRALDTNL